MGWEVLHSLGNYVLCRSLKMQGKKHTIPNDSFGIPSCVQVYLFEIPNWKDKKSNLF